MDRERLLHIIGHSLIFGALAAWGLIAVLWQMEVGTDDGMRAALLWALGAFVAGLPVTFAANGGVKAFSVDRERLSILKLLSVIFLWVCGCCGIIFLATLYMVRPEDAPSAEDEGLYQIIAYSCLAGIPLFGLGYRYAVQQMSFLERIPIFASRYPLLPVEVLAPKLGTSRRRLRYIILCMLEEGMLRGYEYRHDRDVLCRKEQGD